MSNKLFWMFVSGSLLIAASMVHWLMELRPVFGIGILAMTALWGWTFRPWATRRRKSDRVPAINIADTVKEEEDH